ncbi:hypothetical protein J27TS7_10780 [Paenibacillus dendritiformis]|uniref:hypothetical protein n=1 Tax=Paenibacillus dendritiformis TaxID=130049 RepID=UPI001B033198|nr:hypothetical protein [Paenibacillus dendritiformis]GIO71564.1 hypothetical protein J27TS7_10780 [Paenibacillus dendritiformis]
MTDYKKVTSYTLNPEQLKAERERLDALKPRKYKGQTAILASQMSHNGKYMKKGGEWF